jgi:bacillopeptidase F
MCIFITATIVIAGVIHPQLADKLSLLDNNEPFQVIVHMKAQADLSSLPKETTKTEKILYLQEFAKSNQANLINYLESFGENVTIDQTWWIFNGLMFTSTKDIIEAVAKREDVDYVIDNFNCYIDVEHEKHEANTGARTPEWNISKIMADSCWNYGYDGTGIIVGNIDTGVDINHPCFGNRWVPGGWYDGINGQPDPYDDHGHGSHVMGIICGGDGNGPFVDDIGVASGANFIAAKG